MAKIDEPDAEKEEKARWLRQCSGCSNLEDKGTVMRKCSACQNAMYCSRECQKADWKKHKPSCAEYQSWSPAKREGQQLLHAFAKKHRATVSRAAAHVLGLKRDVTIGDRFFFMLDVRRRPGAESPARAFQIKWAQMESFELNQSTRLLKAVHDHLRERQMSKARYPGLLGFYIVFYLGDSTLGEQLWEPIAFTQKDIDQVQDDWGWSAFLYKTVNGGTGLPPGVRQRKEQATFDPGAMVVSTELDEDLLASMRDGTPKKASQPDVFPWEPSPVPKGPPQHARVHECQFSPCRPGSGSNEVSRSCGMCGKTGNAFTPCPSCFQLTYCSIACMKQHIPIHAAVCPKFRGMMKREQMLKISKIINEFTIRYDRQFSTAAELAMELHRTPERAARETLVVHLRRYDGPNGEITHRIVDAHVQPMEVNGLLEAHARYQQQAPKGGLTILTTFYDHTSMCTWIVPQHTRPGYFKSDQFGRKLRAKGAADWKKQLIDEVGGVDEAWGVD